MATATASAPKMKTAKKAATKAKAPADHPKYSEMIVAAIKALKERGGSSRQAILKYIMSNYPTVGTDAKPVNSHMKLALKRLVGGTNSAVKQVKGSFAINKEAVKEKQPKKTAAKKVEKPKVAGTKMAKKPKSPKKEKAPKAEKAAKPKKEAKKKAETPKPEVAAPPAPKLASPKPLAKVASPKKVPVTKKTTKATKKAAVKK